MALKHFHKMATGRLQRGINAAGSRLRHPLAAARGAGKRIGLELKAAGSRLRLQVDAKAARAGAQFGIHSRAARARFKNDTQAARAILKSLSSTQSWRWQAGRLRERMQQAGRLLQSRHYGAPDDFFFSFDELPSFGKEYWFLLFCVPGRREQVVLTFGRAVEEVKVNETDVPARPPGAKTQEPPPSPAFPSSAPSSLNCAAVCWLHGKNKQVILDSSAVVSLEHTPRLKRLRAASGPRESVCIEGSYPHYRALLKKGGRTIFRARILPPKSGMPYEMVHLMRSPLLRGFGADMVNYYFRFEGTLQGKPVAGLAYLQKVLAVLPLAPWNWVRIQFASGAALDFFAAKPLGTPLGEIHFACNDYFEIKGRRIKLGGLKLDSWGEGETRRWVLSGKHLYLSMESYALQPFRMKTKTAFEYDEFLVTVNDFELRADGKTYTLGDVGAGSGIVEDARGYLI